MGRKEYDYCRSCLQWFCPNCCNKTWNVMMPELGRPNKYGAHKCCKRCYESVIKAYHTDNDANRANREFFTTWIKSNSKAVEDHSEAIRKNLTEKGIQAHVVDRALQQDSSVRKLKTFREKISP